MNTIYNVKIACVATLIVIAGTAQAQEDNMKRELTLEREYDPSVQDANKVNTLPAVKQPEIKKTAIDYATQTIPTDPEKEISVLPSGKVMSDILYNKNRGYLNVGAGTYLNMNGDFGYHILNTDKDQLNVFFSHRSSGAKREYIQEETKQKVHLNDNLAGLNFRHNFDKASMRLGARYGYNAFNYFGYISGREASSIALVFPIDAKQVNQQIGINAGVESHEGAALGYLLDVDFTNFSHKYGLFQDQDGIKENTIGVKAGANAPFGGNQLVGVLGKIDYLSYSIPTHVIGAIDPGFENHAEITLSPYYTVEGDIWKIRLGANVMYITGDHDKLFASPNVAVDVEVADKTVLYLKADGRIQSNSAFELSKRNRYVNPWQGVQPSRTWLDGIVGLKSGVAPGFWFDIFTGYRATDNDALFVPTAESNLINYSAADHYNTKLFFAGAALKYSYQNLFEFSLKGVFNSWDVEDVSDWIGGSAPDFEAYGRPKAEITATIDVRPIDKLTISAKYYLATGRKTVFYPLQKWTPIDMDNINELNVTGMYSITKNVGVYGQLNNLLFQKYDLHYGYPTQGFNAMVGVNINF